MILEGFEIENWTCIKKLAVNNLPPTGVIVLHAPNRTGKSSMVQALRACLFDYSSSSTALKRFYPRGRGEKPEVTVTFRVGGTSYRIRKSFGSNKSELQVQTFASAWKSETTSPAEAHNRTCLLAGGDDSSKGLNQLLWLTQAEFRLPDAKKFDAGVQAQLRGILGVLQTPLDDRFIERVKNRWNEWHSGARKADKAPPLKENCSLSQLARKLTEAQTELNEKEQKFKEVEMLLLETENLEVQAKDLRGQLVKQEQELQDRQAERECSQERIGARKLAEELLKAAESGRETAEGERRRRADAASRLADAERLVVPAREFVVETEAKLGSLDEKQLTRKRNLNELRDQRRKMEQQAKSIAARLRHLDAADRVADARSDMERAKRVEAEIAGIKRFLLENPGPEQGQLDQLKDLYHQILHLRSDRDAASMTLIIVPEKGAGSTHLILDGEPPRQISSTASPQSHSVRRRAELNIQNWGRLELARGSSKSDFDEIEAELEKCQSEFAEGVVAFGIAPTDADPLSDLMRRHAELGLKNEELRAKQGELKSIAPKGIEPLHKKVLELEGKLGGSAASPEHDSDSLPIDRADLEDLKTEADHKIALIDGQIAVFEQAIEDAESELSAMRDSVTSAKGDLARLEATAQACAADLARLPNEEEICQRTKIATESHEEALQQLTKTELTKEEATIEERLKSSKEAVSALEQQLQENAGKYNRLKGRLEESEGLHSRRAALAARVDELTRVTTRESYVRESVDRLYELFEASRERQHNTLMSPIHDRVLNWMQALNLGDYKEMRFGDAFLPDKLVRRDGTAEFVIDEESTGAQEQIGMLVRLALGSLLTSANEPTVAILDDPLTHCDVGRLNKMRAILRRAAEGDNRLTPPAGPLQIIILTCHPEWFRDEFATVIDLENVDVMQRFPD